MAESTQNPFAAPREEVADDAFSKISRRPPVSTYGYAFVLFCLGAFSGGFVSSPFYMFYPSAATFLFSGLVSVSMGIFAGHQIFRRLAKIHHRKVGEMEQAERVGQYFV